LVRAAIKVVAADPAARLDRGGCFLGVERVFDRDVAAAAPHLVRADRRRQRLGGIHRDVDHPHACPCRLGEHVDGRASCVEIGDHLRGDLGRIGGYARGGDAVVTGEHHDAGALKLPRRAHPLA
jgi:hypothetical protein